ncbi:MAG: ABC transporter ATP-binding protein [Anaerolineae bacterium]
MNPTIITHHLSKTYRTQGREIRAVRDVSLEVFSGELFGLFGPNGAGKSTIVRILSTLLSPTSGTAVVNGHDVVGNELQVRASIGLVTADEQSFYGRLTAAQNLHFYAAMQNVPRRQIAERTQAVLELFGLAHKADTPAQSLSTGQKQRLNLARALIHDPAILFLDEPTKSMDVQTSDFVKTLIREDLVGRQGKTVMFISHELYEMDNFCDRVVILDEGQVQVVGTPAELGAMLPRRALYRIVIEGNSTAIAARWQAIPGIEAVHEISRGASTTTFDVALADEGMWLAVLQAVEAANGRLETYRRVDDESLRRIVAHFSKGGWRLETGD